MTDTTDIVAALSGMTWETWEDAPNASEVLCQKGADLIKRQASEIDRLRAELARRDRNETRNCINWGPCSLHDGRMADEATFSPQHRGG